VTKGTDANLAGEWSIMKQIANINNGSIERENAGGDTTSAQAGVGVSNLSTMARVEIAIKQQPEFAVLRAKLLEHGGAEVVPPCGWNTDLRQYVIVCDPDLAALVDHGCLIPGPVVCRSRGMEPNRCHENIARLWLQKERGTHSSELQLDIAWIMTCGASIRGVSVRNLCWRPSGNVRSTSGFD